ncbi:MAG TPA: hypothetical protein VLH85_04320 [Levilinea sp.]|nr:hypothetical protein [Levilinea sp.]
MVLAVGLMFSTIPAVFTIPAEALLFQPQPYRQAMRSYKFSQSFPGWMAELVVEGDLQGMEGMPPALQKLQYEEYVQMLQAVLPAEWVEAEIDALIDEFWAYINFRTDSLVLDIELDEPRSRLVGPGSEVVVQTIMNTWPICTPGELEGILVNMQIDAAGAMPLCRPPTEYQPAFVDTIRSGLVIFSSMLPDRISLVELFEIVEESGEMRGMHVADLYDNYRVLRGMMRVSPFLMIVSILLIGLVANRRPRAMFTAWGGPLLIGGMVGMIIAVGLGLAGNLIAESLVRQLAVTRPAGMYQVLVAVVRGVSNQFTLYTSLSGLVVAVIGAGLFLFGRFYTDRQEEGTIVEESFAPYIEEYRTGDLRYYDQDDPTEYLFNDEVQNPIEYPAYEPRYPDEAPTIYPEASLDLRFNGDISEAPTLRTDPSENDKEERGTGVAE